MVVLAGALLSRFRTAARVLLWGAVGLIWVASMPVFSDWLRSTLEWRYLPPEIEDYPAADAIVVLGGMVSGPAAPRVDLQVSEAVDRLLHAAALFEAGKAPVVIASGGGIAWLGAVEPEAVSMKALLLRLGVPDEAVVMETQSRNTAENALYAAEILREREIGKVLLVTSALHMPRAMKLFRAQGIDAVAVPTDLRSIYDPVRTLLDYLPDAESLYQTTLAVKEYLGMVWMVVRRR
ncbi:MAG: YdcF family protein [Pseudomonadota bacterium]|nr:YdcF family protein [Pseudomonadota bacterium]